MARKKVERNISYDDERKKYYVNLDFGIDENGKQIKKTKTFNKLTEARNELKEHEGNKVKGMLTVPQKITVSEWLKYWLEEIVKPNKEQGTYYFYNNIINNHVIPELGKIPLQDLKAVQIQKYYNKKMKESGLSSNTVKKHHNMLLTAFKVAVKQDILNINVVEKVEPPKMVRKEANFYTTTEIQELFERIKGDKIEVAVKLAAFLGLRREELCGLRWQNIDFDKRKIFIKEARTAVGGTVVEKGTKNSSSERTLFISDDLYEVLFNEFEHQKKNRDLLGEAYEKTDYVIVHNDGKPYRPNYVSELFRVFIENNGMRKITLHGLRHSFATNANEMGISLFDISKALGHSTPSTTGRIYTHLTDNVQEDTMTKISSGYMKK